MVKWKGLPDFENSWELVDKVRKEFPEFFLEDKESCDGEGIDRYDRVYVRKKKGQKHGIHVSTSN